jgi:hypothetical protein
MGVWRGFQVVRPLSNYAEIRRPRCRLDLIEKTYKLSHYSEEMGTGQNSHAADSHPPSAAKDRRIRRPTISPNP